MLTMKCSLCAAATRHVSAHAAVCAACAANINLLRLHDPCPRCALPQAGGRCGSCERQPPPLDQVLVRHRYDEPLTLLIQQFKYGQRWQLAATLAQLLPPLPPADAVLPVPLHPARERERGFNQTRELAKKIGAFPTEGLLTRIINTAPQASITARSKRVDNLRGAFHADPAVRGKSLLLIDDVMTTGVTLHEAARALKKAGAKQVSAALVARAIY